MIHWYYINYNYRFIGTILMKIYIYRKILYWSMLYLTACFYSSKTTLTIVITNPSSQL